MPRVDLLTSAGKLRWSEAWSSREERIIEGVRILFADVDSLILSKATSRLQDQADVEMLRFIRDRRGTTKDDQSPPETS